MSLDGRCNTLYEKGWAVPKQVDHAARRLELLDALMRITRADGWDAITVRRVAAEAGTSVGTVQHYFSTKDEMLRFAIEMMADDTRRRIRERVAALPQPAAPRVLVETVLTEMIPDPKRRPAEAEAADVWMRRFTLSPSSTATLAEGGRELMTGLAEAIHAGRGGDPADAWRDAGALIALLDGLIFNIVVGTQTAETAIATIRAQLDYVFGNSVATDPPSR